MADGSLAVNALLEAGCSVAETASISGQSFAMVEHMRTSESSKNAMAKYQGECAKNAD